MPAVIESCGGNIRVASPLLNVGNNGSDFVLLSDNFNQFASQTAVTSADLATDSNAGISVSPAASAIASTGPTVTTSIARSTIYANE